MRSGLSIMAACAGCDGRNTMSDEPMILHEVDGAVATITLNRPKALNALNALLMDELCRALAAHLAARWAPDTEGSP